MLDVLDCAIRIIDAQGFFFFSQTEQVLVGGQTENDKQVSMTR